MTNQTVTQDPMDFKINFMKLRYPALILSAVLVIVSFLGIWKNGFNLGVDFTGGTIIEVSYPQAAELNSIRALLAEEGFDEAQVQHFGSAHEVMLRLAPKAETASAQLSEEVFKLLKDQDAGVELRRVEFVGPQVGEELTVGGALAVLYALIAILIYVAFRFEFRMALGAVIALAHDVILALGVFAWFQVQFDLTTIAAVLAIIGYSLNDSIVVSDRIREVFRQFREEDAMKVTNKALNDMLSRTIMTSLTTILALVALLAFGGETLYGFSLALIIGVVAGTYSSVYIGTAIAVELGLSRKDLLVPVKVTDSTKLEDDELHREFLEQEARRKVQD